VRYSPKTTLLACVLVLLMPSAPIRAEGMNTSEGYLFFSTLASAAVVFSPVLMSEKLHDLSTRTDCDCPPPRRNAADNVPPMEVKDVGLDENDIARVHLQAPDNPEMSATLTLSGREAIAAGFREGHLVSFHPSPQASGWLLRDDTGTWLAFVPTEGAARENHAALF